MGRQSEMSFITTYELFSGRSALSVYGYLHSEYWQSGSEHLEPRSLLRHRA